MVKAKTRGYDAHGVWQQDKWQDKRLLFKRNIGLDKHGTIGKFWHGGLEAIKQEAKQAADTWRNKENYQDQRYIEARPQLKAQIVKHAANLCQYFRDDYTKTDAERAAITVDAIASEFIAGCRKGNHESLDTYFASSA
jgi:hypothetical protein